MTREEITKKYEQLLNDVATQDYYKVDLTNRLNAYVCQLCGHGTVTKDVSAGVTPFMHQCEMCGGMAYSAMYRVLTDRKPTQEWYRPTLEELLEMDKWMVEHVLNGGLANRKIEPTKS